MNVEKLIQALENEDNADILKYSLDDLENIKINILEELEMNEPEIVSILTKLKQYKYVEHPNELKYGSYVRWISLAQLYYETMETINIFNYRGIVI
jgi:hypothetical protein